MKELKIIFSIIIMFTIFSSCKGQKDKFEVGQIWQYKTRTNEPNSTLQILKIDKIKNEEIIHIYVSGLKLKNPNKEDGISSEIGHLPISKDAFSKSVTKLVSIEKKIPDFIEGYTLWKNAFDNGNAGSFNVSVSEAVDFVEESLTNPQKVE